MCSLKEDALSLLLVQDQPRPRSLFLFVARPEVYFGPSSPLGGLFRTSVSQKPPRLLAPPPRPPLSLLATFQLLFWISQTAPVRSSLPSHFCHPRSRAAPPPRPPVPSTCAQEPSRTSLTGACQGASVGGAGGAFRPREARRRLCGVLTSVCCCKAAREHLGSTPLPWNSAWVRFQDLFFFFFFKPSLCACVWSFDSCGAGGGTSALTAAPVLLKWWGEAEKPAESERTLPGRV